MDLSYLLTPEAFSAFLQVIMIDLVLAGDNAVVIGLAAAGLPKDLRSKAILIGIAAATVMRIGFALITTQLLAITGLLLAGGLLLLWVCWKMYQELTVPAEHHEAAAEAVTGTDINKDGTVGGGAPRKTLRQAVTQIIIADVSMSLDNVLAVAGAAHDHPEILIFGLVLSVALMGLASTFIAGLLNKHRWIAWVGLVIILYVAAKMIYEGADQLMGHTLPAIPLLKDAAAVAIPAADALPVLDAAPAMDAPAMDTAPAAEPAPATEAALATPAPAATETPAGATAPTTSP